MSENKKLLFEATESGLIYSAVDRHNREVIRKQSLQTTRTRKKELDCISSSWQNLTEKNHFFFFFNII